MKKVFVLAGGFGTRLRAVVSDVPKPLASVCGKPFLLYLIENLVVQGAKEFIFLLHYEAGVIEAQLEQILSNKNLEGVKITSIVENEPLGTGGSIKNAIKALDIKESFIVVNADTWLGSGFEELARCPPNAVAAVKVKDCSRYGSLLVSENTIEQFLEKDISSGAGLINAGLYHLMPAIFNGVTKSTKFSLETDILPRVADEGGLSAVPISTTFIDIGVPADYERFCRWIASGKKSEL